MSEELQQVLAGAGLPATLRASFGLHTLEVAPEHWLEALTVSVAAGHRYLDFITGVDEGEPGIAVICRLWDRATRTGVLLRTLTGPAAELASVSGVLRGAAWHEREVQEMFGVRFTGHPDPRPLLLPEDFGAHPLRKDFALAARSVKAWPGEVEPGQREAPARRRRRPPGAGPEMIQDPGRKAGA